MQIFVSAARAAVAAGAMTVVAGCAAGPRGAATGIHPGGTQAGAGRVASASPASLSGTPATVRAAAGPGACPPPPPETPIAAELTLTMASSGHTYCLRTGGLVRMEFFGLPTAWLPVRLSGDALVPVTDAGSRIPVPRGPSNLYRAVHPGTATLTQTRPCAPLHPVSQPGIGPAGPSGCPGRPASFRAVIIVS